MAWRTNRRTRKPYRMQIVQNEVLASIERWKVRAERASTPEEHARIVDRIDVLNWVLEKMEEAGKIVRPRLHSQLLQDKDDERTPSGQYYSKED